MIYVSVIGEDHQLRTFGGNIHTLMKVVKSNIPKGYDYRLISKSTILRLEVLSPDPHIVIWTNLSKQCHPWVIDELVGAMDENDTELDE